MRIKSFSFLALSFLLVLLSWLVFSPAVGSTTGTTTATSPDLDEYIESVKTKDIVAQHLVKRTSNPRVAALSSSARAKSGMFARQSQPRGPRASVPDQIIVKYKQGRTTGSTRRSIAARYNMRSKKYVRFADIHVYKLQSARAQRQVLRELKRNPAVEYAEPDYILSIDTVPNDPSLGQLWGLHNTGQSGGTADADIDAAEAWDVTTGSRDVVVAVIDTGVDYTHPDLQANMWTNTGEIPGDNIDNDGNGYVDDLYGMNAITGSGNPLDDHSHGTHCAGTIGGVGNNNTGVVGVAWKVKIMGCKFLSSSGSGSTSDAIDCIQYAVDNGAHIMSNSWGGGGYSVSLYNAIETAKQHGILFVAAAGNSGTNNDTYAHYPSSYNNANVLAVAATDRNDNLASFSCYGPTSVDVAAPGVSIYSTLPGNSYGSYSGTSMATPHVAGLAALIKAVNPGYTYVEIKNQILDSVEQIPSLQGKILTQGRINAYYAIMYNSPPSLSITNPQDNAFVSGTVSIQANATDNDGITKVEFYIDDSLAFTDTSSPYAYSWDTTAVSDSQHTIKVIAYDTDQRTAVKEITSIVNNSGLPGITISTPSEGDTLLGKIDINVTASYGPGITKVEFYIDGGLIGEDTAAPYTYNWDSLSVANGDHTVTAKAYGTDASIGTDSITVNIDNIIIPESERNALIALYNSTNGDNWYLKTNWKKEDGSFNDPGTEYTWYGISVVDNHVDVIDLAYNDLEGPIPSQIGDLPNLKELVLYWNYINGSLPVELGSLSQLEYLDLDWNELTGTITPELGNLTQLETLWLNDNFFSGGIPAEFGNMTNLQYLYLWDSQLTGTIPPELGNLSNLKSLALYYNDLTGTIPVELGNLTQLTYLDLDGNQLTGEIPSELGNCTQLYTLWLSDNQFSGSIPTSIGNMTSLTLLFLDNNQLTGSLPVEIGNLSNIYIFWIQRNKLGGPLPAEIGNLTNMRYFMIYSNMFSGEIPSSITNLTKMTDTGYNYASLDYNGLYTTDETVRQFVTDMDYNWESTQTIPPSNITAAVQTCSSITLNWTRIPFYYYTGRYNIYVSNTPGGPYTLKGSTSSKTATSFDINDLLPETTYYFVIRSETDANGINANTILSDNSTEITVSTPAYQNITIASPNGGESWDGCSTYPITWTSEGPVGNLTIEYSTSGMNGTYIPIAASVPDSGSYNWTVPDTDAPQCYLRIRDVDNYPSDTSDAAFTLKPCPAVNLTSPGGGEQIQRGYPFTVRWSYVNMSGSITLDLYKGGALVQTLGTADVTTRSFTWSIPAEFALGNDYKIRAYQDSVEDYSGSNFKIVSYKPFADFNKDGKPDLLWRYYSTGGKNVIWYMDGHNRTGYSYINSVTDLNWKIVGTGDFNNDGNTDILWRHNTSTTGYNIVWFMNGATRIGWSYITRVKNIYWKIVGTGDFNGDGKTDILWRYDRSGYGYNAVWYMNGITKIGHDYLNRVSNTNWRVEAINDFNGDGKPDIMWRYYASPGYVAVWYMNGAVRTGYSYLPSVSNLNWRLEGSGDFNADGQNDLIWRYHRSGGGQNVIWYLNGPTKTGHTYFQRVYNLNWNIENH